MKDEQILEMFKALNKRIDEIDKKYDRPAMRSDKGMAENGQSILDVADLADENSTSIEELADMLQDHEDRISELEREANDGK